MMGLDCPDVVRKSSRKIWNQPSLPKFWKEKASRKSIWKFEKCWFYLMMLDNGISLLGTITSKKITQKQKLYFSEIRSLLFQEITIGYSHRNLLLSFVPWFFEKKMTHAIVYSSIFFFFKSIFFGCVPENRQKKSLFSLRRVIVSNTSQNFQPHLLPPL